MKISLDDEYKYYFTYFVLEQLLAYVNKKLGKVSFAKGFFCTLCRQNYFKNDEIIELEEKYYFNLIPCYRCCVNS